MVALLKRVSDSEIYKTTCVKLCTKCNTENNELSCIICLYNRRVTVTFIIFTTNIITKYACMYMCIYCIRTVYTICITEKERTPASYYCSRSRSCSIGSDRIGSDRIPLLLLSTLLVHIVLVFPYKINGTQLEEPFGSHIARMISSLPQGHLIPLGTDPFPQFVMGML